MHRTRITDAGHGSRTNGLAALRMYSGFSRSYPGRSRITPDVYRGSVGMLVRL
jgi:hypothetical protein